VIAAHYLRHLHLIAFGAGLEFPFDFVPLFLKEHCYRAFDYVYYSLEYRLQGFHLSS
jgi:hypothetical protein